MATPYRFANSPLEIALRGSTTSSAPEVPVTNQFSDPIQTQQDAANLAAEIEANRAQFQAPIDLNNAYNNAYNTGMTSIELAGLNPNLYSSQLENQLNMIRSQVPQGAQNVGSYFAGDIGQNVLAQALANQQNQTLSTMNMTYAPGWADAAIADTADDAFINDILGSQYDDAMLGLQRSMDRGTLNQTGYDAALGALGDQRSAAMGDLQNIGGGILSGYRNSLNSLADQGWAASQYGTLANPFDVGGLTDRINTRGESLLGGLEGDLRSNVGGRQFFDMGSLVNKGGAAQGATNSASIATLLGNQQDKQKQRGLGSQGVF